MKQFSVILTILLFATGCVSTAPATLEINQNAQSGVVEDSAAAEVDSTSDTDSTAASAEEPATDDSTGTEPTEPQTETTTDSPASTNDATTEELESEQPATEQPTVVIDEPQRTTTSNGDTDTDAAAQEIEVLLQIVSLNDVEDYAVSITDGATVEQVMQKAKGRGLTYEKKSFGSIGAYITTINGLEEDPQSGFYWIYSVNGVTATAGISQQTVTARDTITWNYEKEF